MQTQGITPSFGKTHVNSSKMNERQKILTDRIITVTEYTDEFKKADENNVDIYFIPKGKKSVNVVCVDNDSQQIFQERKQKRIINSFSTDMPDSKLKQGIESFIKTLKQINSGEIDKPHIWDHLIAGAKTDVAKMRPELYKDIDEDIKVYTGFGIDKDDAIEVVAEDFVQSYINTNKNDEF